MTKEERKVWKDGINNTVAHRLKETRKNNNYTQEQYAELLGLDTTYYKKMENGKNSIHPGYLIILREKCHVDINYLLTGQPTEKFDVDLFLHSSDFEAKVDYFGKTFAYATKMLKHNEEVNRKKDPKLNASRKRAGSKNKTDDGVTDTKND